MTRPRSLIVVPVFNGARYLEETLHSLLSQSLRPDRIICIDDASTDESRAVIEGFQGSGIELHRNSVRMGLASNWNRGLQLAESQFVTIAHQDDIYEPEYLAEVTLALEEHPNSFIAHTKATTIDSEGNVLHLPATRYKNKFWEPGPFTERPTEKELALLIKGDYVFCPSVTFRTSAISDIGHFNEDYEFVPDWDYWLRGLFAGHTITGVNKKLLRYRFHDSSATAAAEATLRRYREEIDVLEKHLARASAQGIPIDRGYTAAEHTLIEGIVRQLQSGRQEKARALLRIGRESLPGFRSSLKSMGLGVAVSMGRFGGWLMHTAMNAYLRIVPGPRL